MGTRDQGSDDQLEAIESAAEGSRCDGTEGDHRKRKSIANSSCAKAWRWREVTLRGARMWYSSRVISTQIPASAIRGISRTAVDGRGTTRSGCRAAHLPRARLRQGHRVSGRKSGRGEREDGPRGARALRRRLPSATRRTRSRKAVQETVKEHVAKEVPDAKAKRKRVLHRQKNAAHLRAARGTAQVTCAVLLPVARARDRSRPVTKASW